ncbi:MAG: hypothetical protein ACOYJ6_20945, partial [Caulobacterales bacterium]
QATANAMAERMAQITPLLFAGEPNLVLAHAATDIAPALALQPENAAREGDHPDGATTASAAAASWIADERRKAFLPRLALGQLTRR